MKPRIYRNDAGKWVLVAKVIPWSKWGGALMTPWGNWQAAVWHLASLYSEGLVDKRQS